MKILLTTLLSCLSLAAKDLPAAMPDPTAAVEFLAALDDAQRAKAALPFDSDERGNFRYTPRVRAGLPFKEMTEAQRAAAKKLLESALSEKGGFKVTQIMSLEAVLAEIEKNPERRDHRKYYVAIFGTPGEPKGWGWRFEGHHISINLTAVEGRKTSLTPSFLGANPAEVRHGPLAGLRVLAAEEDLARVLVTSLLSTGKSKVIFSEKAPAEILSGESRKVGALVPVGLPATEMSETQRQALIQLISEYTGRYRKDLADADMAKIQDAGIDRVRFAWAGGTKPGEAYYYRIQGPTFLMEAANTQNDANHIHAVWRDFEGDFGRDILGEHFHHDH